MHILNANVIHYIDKQCNQRTVTREKKIGANKLCMNLKNRKFKYEHNFLLQQSLVRCAYIKNAKQRKPNFIAKKIATKQTKLGNHKQYKLSKKVLKSDINNHEKTNKQ